MARREDDGRINRGREQKEMLDSEENGGGSRGESRRAEETWKMKGGKKSKIKCGRKDKETSNR